MLTKIYGESIDSMREKQEVPKSIKKQSLTFSFFRLIAENNAFSAKSFT